MPPKRRGRPSANITSSAPEKRSKTTRLAAQASTSTAQSIQSAADTSLRRPSKKTKTTGKERASQRTRQRDLRNVEPSDRREIVEIPVGEEQPRVNSNEAEVPQSTEVASNVSQQLTDIFQKLLNSVRDANSGGNNLQIINRMTTAKRLPCFSGIPLEWINFKDVYELTTELGGYSDRDNIARLFEALKGEARELVGTLLSANRDPNAVMQTLDLHYGNKKALANRISDELYAMPRLDNKRMPLILFATRLRNAVASFKAHGLTDHLQNPELTLAMGRKLPESLLFEYARFMSDKSEKGDQRTPVPELELLSDFLFTEAERTSKTVLFNSEIINKFGERRAANSRHEPTRRRADVFNVTGNADTYPRDKNEHQQSNKCAICNVGNHEHIDCPKIQRESPKRRRSLVAAIGLCYGCLKAEHKARFCRNQPTCLKCNYCHSDLLPCYEGRQGDRQRGGNRNYSTKANPGSSRAENSRNQA